MAPSRERMLCLLAVLSLFGTGSSSLSAQGLTTRFAAEGGRVDWADGLGLTDANLFGGGLSLGFGRYVSLHGGYRRASGLTTSLVDAGFADFVTISENVLDVDLFSTEVQLRLGARRFAPIVTGGGGVLGVSPYGRDRVRQVFLSYGGGVDVRLQPWLDARLLLSDIRFRLDRSTYAGERGGIEVPSDPERARLRSSPTLGVSVGARLGAGRSDPSVRTTDEGPLASLERLLIPLELNTGRLMFSDALALDDQSLVGVRAGLDFGPYFGLRASYASGASGFGSFGGLQSWSGEAQFNVGRVTTAAPHLIVGFGQISFDDDFRDRNDVTPPDKTTLVVGAGFGVPINDRSRVLLALRDHITTSGALADASSTGDLRHNFGITLGLSYLVVGRRASPPSVRGGSPVAIAGSSQPASPLSAGEARVVAGDSVPFAAERPNVDYHSDRVVTIPIPREGELYIRYGPVERTLPGVPQPAPQLAATTDSATLVGIVRGELNRAGVDTTALTRGDLALLEQRIVDRLLAGAPAQPNPAPTDRREIDELSDQVRELSEIVRQGLIQRAQPMPDLVTLVPADPTAPGLMMVATEPRGPFLRGLDFRLGTTSVRNGRAGAGTSVDLSLGYLGSSRIRPYVGLEAGRTSVRTTFGGSSVFGSVISIGGGAGLALDLPRLGPLAPALSVGLGGVGGGTSGSSEQDEDLMDQLYGGLAMGPSLALGGAWLGDTRPAGMDITGRVKRVWAGSRTRWALEVGLQWRRDSAPRFAVGRAPVTSALPTVPPQPAPDSAAAAADDFVPVEPASQPAVETPTAFQVDTASGASIELLRRLEALETALEAERLAREREAEEARAARARADSLSALASDARAAELERAARAAARAEIRRHLESLAALLDDLTSVRPSERGLEITLGGSIFPVGSSALATGARSQIERLASEVARVEGYLILVEGHTDARGSDETNLALSRLRAEAVRTALVDAGLDPSRITPAALGESRPIADNATAEGRARNRRVVVVLVGFDG